MRVGGITAFAGVAGEATGGRNKKERERGGERARGSEKRLPLHASRRVPRKRGQIREDG